MFTKKEEERRAGPTEKELAHDPHPKRKKKKSKRVIRHSYDSYFGSECYIQFRIRVLLGVTMVYSMRKIIFFREG